MTAPQWHPPLCSRAGFAALLAGLVASAGATAQPWSFDGLRPTYRSADGDFTLVVRTRLQIDAGAFDQDNSAQRLHAGAIARRAYLGVEGDALRALHYEFRVDFAGERNRFDSPNVNLARIAYNFGSGETHLRLNAGLIKPIFTLADSTSSASLPFLERAAVINVAATGYGGGTTRPGIELSFEEPGLVHATDNFLISAAFTGKSALGGNAGSHLLGRLAYRLWSDDISTVQIGGSAARILDTGEATPHAVVLEDAPEIRVDDNALAGTGAIPATGGTLLGLEGAATIGSFHLAGEYYRFGLQRAGAADPHFSGWYVQAAWTLTGRSRVYLPNATNNNVATFANPEVAAPFSPGRGDWGVWEIAARYSDLDLDWHAGAPGTVCASCVRGGRQKIWSFGLNWYLSDNLRMLFDAMIVDVARLDAAGQQAGQRFTAVGTRLQFSN